ncbi:rRNA maturation RNase YbeY [Patescibacteria group bacterium]|nr:rRNA maturation RNase YbeY [Patescibacteria group bacterium]
MSQVFIGYDTYGIEGVDESFIHFIFDMTLAQVAGDQNSEVGLVVTSDEQMRSLNHRYRDKDRSTNVLSFANDEIKDFVSTENSLDKNYLGDVYISYPTLMREAHDLHETSRERFAQLFIHGVLHLLGFDHEDKADAEVMEQLEDKILATII